MSDGLKSTDLRKYRPDYGPSNRELLPIAVGGKNYEFKFEPRCKVCKSGTEVLHLVNKLLVSGATYADVERSIEFYNKTLPERSRISYSSIRTHQLNHMPFRASAVRKVIEKRAMETQKDFIAGENSVVDALTYAEVMMNQGFRMMTEDGAIVTPKEGLEAAKAFQQMTKDEQGQMDAALAMSQLNRIINAVKKIVPEEMFQRIIEELDREEESVQIDSYEDVVDAEEVDDDFDEDFDPELESDEDEDEDF